MAARFLATLVLGAGALLQGCAPQAPAAGGLRSGPLPIDTLVSSQSPGSMVPGGNTNAPVQTLNSLPPGFATAAWGNATCPPLACGPRPGT